MRARRYAFEEPSGRAVVDGMGGAFTGGTLNCAWGTACRVPAPTSTRVVCGDGKRSGTEGCDDGNAVGGDGCSATCALESGWFCTGYDTGGTDICALGSITLSDGFEGGSAAPWSPVVPTGGGFAAGAVRSCARVRASLACARAHRWARRARVGVPVHRRVRAADLGPRRVHVQRALAERHHDLVRAVVYTHMHFPCMGPPYDIYKPLRRSTVVAGTVATPASC